MESVVLLLALASYVVFPIIGLWVAQKFIVIKKLSVGQWAVLYITSLITLGAAWGVSRLFVPLGLVLIPVAMSLLVKIATHLNARSTALFSIIYTAVLLALITAASYLFTLLLSVK